ncbi:MAG TPA: hypothetical protein VKN76_01905 [Kiloniellaceae bacterium]|nr:hypothetical protein [Kiloniellaceae bacterium]
MIQCENQEEAAEIESRILALSQSIDAVKDDALSLFVAHRHKEALRDSLAHLIQGLDDAWQCCRLEGAVAETTTLVDLKDPPGQDR